MVDLSGTAPAKSPCKGNPLPSAQAQLVDGLTHHPRVLLNTGISERERNSRRIWWTPLTYRPVPVPGNGTPERGGSRTKWSGLWDLNPRFYDPKSYRLT